MKKKRHTIVDSNRWLKTKHSSIVEKRLRELFSELPPINFSIQPHILHQRDLWRYNIHTNASATTKSWLSTPTTRCDRANQRPQLRHVTAGPFKNPNPYPHNHFLYDSLRYQYCTPLYPDPFDSKNKLMEFTRLFESRGKFYATSLQGALVEMQMLDTRLKITAVGGVRAVPSVPSRFFKEYLVEMKGEILLVFLIHEKSLAVVDNVKVFRLDLDKLDFIKVERLRGNTMILKEKSVWLDSEEFGCRDDCVFFTEGNENIMWRVYDMKTCCISSV